MIYLSKYYILKMKKVFFQIIFISLFFSCKSQLSPIKSALKSTNEKIVRVMENKNIHDIQIKLTVIKEKKSKKRLKTYNYQIANNNYFYPASTVKLPISIFAIEKLNENPIINLDTKFKIENDSVITTIRDEINEIMVMSSNESYNRLFEFLGQDYIQNKLKEKGINKSVISHRLSTKNSFDIKTKKITFYTKDSLEIEYPNNENKKLDKIQAKNLYKGYGFVDNYGKLISNPMDFSEKNYFPINDLHRLMKIIFLPEKFKNKYELKLTQEQLKFLKTSMSLSPKDIGYDSKEFYDTYSNLFIYGDMKNKPNDEIKIFNKIGFAYGHVIESAFIKTKRSSFILSAIIKVNNNRIYNDNIYEYESVGFPFFAELGREIAKVLDSN